VNAFLLSIQNGASPFWLTFRTAREAGGNVRKGAKSQIAVFWKTYSPKEELSKPDGTRDFIGPNS
jgi:antirestriction protein ArdC